MPDDEVSEETSPEEEAPEEVPPGEAVLVAVDFTPRSLRVLLADEEGAPLTQETWELPELADEEAWSWEVGGRIATLFAADGARRSALAVVIAAPGIVHPITGRLVRSDEPGVWTELPVVELLRRHIDAPIAAENRTVAALLGETWQGAAFDHDDVLFISLRGIPTAAMLSAGRPVRGTHYNSGQLPAVPQLADGALSDEDLEVVSGVLADAAALLGPSMVVLDGADEHLERLLPLLQRVIDEVAPGPQVERSQLGENAALVGAVRIATTLAYEGPRRP